MKLNANNAEIIKTAEETVFKFVYSAKNDNIFVDGLRYIMFQKYIE